ncbi:MAG: enoyl-CoA hydratase/isomerase family protein [SAR202 cluster bacterium]|nr:enoyl-CoA hydratase/isomerase family protein [SAR202 cluster bacterium]
MQYNNIKLEQGSGVATLRLNRPGALNALSPALLQEVSQALTAVAADETVKALVVRGEGRSFCAGADLLFFEEAFNQPDRLAHYLKLLNGCMFQMEELPVPVIAVVHGYALAGGLELALACDMALAAEDARLGDQHANFGLMPGGGSTQRLPRRIGMQRAMELLTTGRWLLGSEAAAWGLVLRAVPAAELDAELEKLLAPLRSKSRAGLGWIKSVARRGQDLALRDGIALESLAFVQYVATSPHPKEGIQAFKEKRQPVF